LRKEPVLLAKRPTIEQKKSHSTAVGEACAQKLTRNTNCGVKK